MRSSALQLNDRQLVRVSARHQTVVEKRFLCQISAIFSDDIGKSFRQVSTKWKKAFDTNEVACERLGLQTKTFHQQHSGGREALVALDGVRRHHPELTEPQRTRTKRQLLIFIDRKSMRQLQNEPEKLRSFYQTIAQICRLTVHLLMD